MENELKNNKEKKQKSGMLSVKRHQNLFLILLLAYPVIQFCIFYIGTNFNSILLSLQKYDIDTGKYYLWGFGNFKEVILDIFSTGKLVIAIKNSSILFAVNTFIALPLHVYVAYCVWKKTMFSGFFKIVLFMPSMISSTVFALIVKFILRDGIPDLFNDPTIQLLTTFDNTAFKTILVYDLWLGFASGMVVFLSALSSISEDVIEYSKLENLSTTKELWHIVIPGIFPTITTYLLVSMAGFFTNYGSYFTFFGEGGRGSGETLGFYFFVKLLDSSKVSFGDFPYASAGGLLFTAVIAPLTLLVKWLMEKYGPSED